MAEQTEEVMIVYDSIVGFWSKIRCRALGHKWRQAGVGLVVCVRPACRGITERRTVPAPAISEPPYRPVDYDG